MALSKPPPKSKATGLGWPARGVGPQLLAVTIPAPLWAARTIKVGLVPRIPEASTKGVWSRKPRKSQASRGRILSPKALPPLQITLDLAHLFRRYPAGGLNDFQNVRHAQDRMEPVSLLRQSLPPPLLPVD